MMCVILIRNQIRILLVIAISIIMEGGKSYYILKQSRPHHLYLIMSERTDEVVFLNNCELLLESLSAKSRGSYYLVWKKGKKSTQSGRYTLAPDEPQTPKELLALSLKVYQTGNLPLPRHTHLILFNGAGEELARSKLMLHEWTGEFKESSIELGPVTVRLRVKRRAIMKLEKFHRLRSEVEETSEDEAGRFRKKLSSQQSETEREAVVRLTKEVEDQGFLIERMKEERTTALIRIETLQKELGKVQDRMRQDLSKLRQYSSLQMDMRQSIYKEEIQHLITSFNRNYELNHGLLQGLIKEKYEYEREIQELKDSNQEYITHQEANFERIITEMENHKKEVDEELQDSNEKLKERERTITELNDQLDSLNSQAQQMRTEIRELLAERERDHQTFREQTEQRNAKIAEYQDIIDADKLNIQNLTQELSIKQSDFLELNKLYDESLAEKTEITKQHLGVIEEKEHLITDNAIMNNELVKLRQEVEDQVDAMSKLKEQYELNTNELMKELQSRELNFTKELETLRNENLILHAKTEEANNQAEILKLQNDEAFDQVKAKEAEVQLYQRELESQKQVYDHLLKENAESLEHFKGLEGQLNERLGVFINRATELQMENRQLQIDNKDLAVRSSDELDRIRDEYERMMESNKKLFDDEMELIRVQREEETMQYQAVKGEYDQEIVAMMEHHKDEVEDLDHLFKEELESKTREYVELLQKNSKLTEELDELKMQAELEKTRRGADDGKRKGKMPRRWPSKIPEEDEEDELIETVEVQSEEEEDEEPLIVVKKKLPVKKKPSPPPQDEEEEEMFQDIPEEGEGEDDGESIVGLYKQKHTRKSKMRKGGKISIKSFNDSESVEEEQQQPPKKASPPPSKKRLGKPKKMVIEELSEQERPEIVQQLDKSSEAEEVIELASEVEEVQPEPQPPKRSHQKPKLQKKVSKKVTKIEAAFTEEDFEELKAEKEALEERSQAQQRQIFSMKKQDRKSKDRFQKQQRKYQSKIKALQGQIQELKIEITELNTVLGDKEGKVHEANKKQAQSRRKQTAAEGQRKETARQHQEQRQLREASKKQVEEPPSPKSVKAKPKKETQSSPKAAHKEQSHVQTRKSPSPSRQFSEKKLLERISELQSQIQDKERRIARLDKQNRELSRQVQHISEENLQRQQMLESKVLHHEAEKRITTPSFSAYPPHYLPPASSLQLSSAEPALKASIANLEDRVLSEKQKHQEAKLRLESKVRECEALEVELRRAKQRVEEVEEKMRRQNLPRGVQELQSELQEGNRKVLELSRTVNQTRLERDSFEDEVRILKKKMAQLSKLSQEWQAKAGEGERQLQDLRRKELRWKREAEEWREQEKRLKEGVRRGMEELGEVRKSQSEFIIERKKILDEVVRLEGVLAQKETEAVRQTKEFEKLRGKLNEESQGRTGKERELRGQFERLEIERSKAERKTRELEETIKLLKEKLDTAQKQSKKGMEERKQTYGDKLRRYIQEIMAVKRVVEDYQQQNSHLKIQNSQFFQQNQILKMSYEKLEIKLEEMTQHQLSLQNQITALQQKLNSQNQSLKRKSEQQAKSSTLLSTIRRELDNERIASRKKTEKLQSYEQINERYLYQIKNLKLKLSQYEMHTDDTLKLAEDLHVSQRTIDSLQEQLHKVTEEYQLHSNQYIFTREEVEAALRDLRDHELKIKEEEIGRVVAELDEAHVEGRSNMETELLTLYAENEKLRVALQKATEDAVQFQHQFSEIQTLRERTKGLEKERSMLDRRSMDLTEQLKSAREENRRLEVRFNESVRSQEGKATENALLLQKNDELARRLREVGENYNELKVEDRRLLEKYKQTVNEKETAIEKLQTEVQGLSNKLLADQLEIRRLREMEKLSTDDAVKRVRKLEARIEELTNSHQQTLREVEVKYKGQIKELKITLGRYEEQMTQKLHRIEELNEGVLMLQSEVQEITSELTAARSQLAQQGEIYTLQINKLRNSMRDMETNYDQNLRNLEEELSAMSKELTALKFTRENVGNSRLKGSRHSDAGEDKAAKRWEDKIKLKDRRIEELKETVLVLEQKLTMQQGKGQLKGSGQTTQGNTSLLIEQMRTKIADLQKQHKTILQKKDSDISKLTLQLKQIKEQLFRLKGVEQQLTLSIQQKDFEIQACQAELSMVSRLYNDLQREVEGRKEGLDIQLRQEAALQIELQAKGQELSAKGDILAMLEGKCHDLEGNLKKKIGENRSLILQVQELSKEKAELLSQERRKLQGESLAKLKLRELQKELQTHRNQTRKLRNELSLSLKESDSLKSDLIQKDAALANLLQEVKTNDKKIEDSQKTIQRYISLNELSLSQLQTPLEGVLNLCIELKQRIQVINEQLSALSEEHEELKFLYERKYLDLQEAKRQNYELVLRGQERELNFQELDALHERVAWLQEENKELVFRLEAFRVQLEGVYSQEGNEGHMRERIMEILADRYV